MIYVLIGYMVLFIHRPFEVWPVLGTIRLERIYMIFTLIYWLMLSPYKGWVHNRLNPAFFAVWVVVLLAWLASPYADAAVCSSTVEDYFKVAVFYLLALSSIRGEEDLKKISLGYVAVVTLYMTHSLWEFRNGRHEYRMGIPRMIGVDTTYNDPNTFAATILYSLPMTLPFWPECKRRLHKLALVYVTGLTVVCILLTGSRSGLAALGVLGLVIFPKLRRSKVALLALVLSTPVAWLNMGEDLQNRFWTLIDPSAGPESAKGSAEGRAQGFYDGACLLAQNPVLGVGPAGFGFATGTRMQAHNLYGQTMGELGTLGVVAFAAVLAGFAGNSWETRRLSRPPSPLGETFSSRLSGAVMISVLLMLVKGWGDHNFYRYTWLWLGAFQSAALKSVRDAYASARAHALDLDEEPSEIEGGRSPSDLGANGP